METLYKFVSGAMAGILALFAPVAPLVICAFVFIAIDFLSGVAADRSATLRRHEKWYFESRKAWRTILKLLCSVTAIVMAWMMDRYILGALSLHLARLFAGFICGVELWSFLENAAQLSEAPIFLKIRQIAKRHLEQRLNVDPSSDPNTPKH